MPDSLIKTVFNIVVLIAGLFYLFEFINGSIHILAGVDDYTASSWESIKKAYTIIIIVIVVFALVMIIPVLNILAAFALFIVGIAGLIIFIWELVLMYKTARALKNF